MPDPTPPPDLLKLEVDRLRLENQELHRELRRLGRPSALLRRVAEVAYADLRARVRRRRAAHALAPDTAAPAPSFRPYVVRRIGTPAPASVRPRVLHAIGNFYTGGSPRLVVDLVERLSDGYDQTTVVRDAPPEPHYVGLALRQAPSFRSWREASALLRRLRPDLVHVHYVADRRHGYGRADWDWYAALMQATEDFGCPALENVNIPVAPYFSDAVRCYVFVSDYVRGLFGRTGDRNVTIYPGSNVELFSRRGGEGPPEGCLGMVYRLEKDKLDETAIDVFAEVLRRRPGTKALIVGGGRFLESFRARVAEANVADSVVFTGYVPYEALPELYEQMTVFVAPPHTESFGHVVPLALSMQIPVAAYAVGALPEILGPEATLAPPGDVDALASRVVELLDSPDRRRRIGAAGRDRARQLFSVERMAAEYRALYDELLT